MLSPYLDSDHSGGKLRKAVQTEATQMQCIGFRVVTSVLLSLQVPGVRRLRIGDTLGIVKPVEHVRVSPGGAATLKRPLQ